MCHLSILLFNLMCSNFCIRPHLYDYATDSLAKKYACNMYIETKTITRGNSYGTMLFGLLAIDLKHLKFQCCVE